MYIKKDNFYAKLDPSIVEIEFAEAKQVQQILMDMLNAMKGTTFKPKLLLANYKPSHPNDDGFWEKDTFYTNSKSLRIRPVWNSGGFYHVWINTPREYKKEGLEGKVLGPKVYKILRNITK